MRKFPIDYQDGKKDCGVCALRMILKWHGGEVPKEYLKDLAKLSKEGTSAYHLIEAGRTLGLEGKGVKGNFEDIDTKFLPCIAHTVVEKSYQHFVVIYKIDYKRRKVIIGDPAKGLKRLNFQDFKNISTGQYLLFQAKKKLESWQEESFLAKVVFSLQKEEPQIVICLFVFSFLSVCFSFLSSYQWKILYESMILPMTRRNQEVIFLTLSLLPLYSHLCNFLRNRLLNYWNHRLDEKLFQKVYDHLTSLSYLYYKNRTTGEVLSRINDLGTITTWLGEGLFLGGIEVLTSLILFSVLWFISWKMSILFLVLLLFQIFIVLLFSKRKERRIHSVKERASLLQSFLTESFEGMETVKNLHIEEEVQDHFSITYSKFREASYKYHTVYQKETFLKSLTQDWGANVISIVGSILIVENKMGLGTLLLYQSLSHYVWNFSYQLGEIIHLWKGAKVSLKRIQDVLSIPREKEGQKYFCKWKLEGSICLKNLNYSYNSKKRVLQHVDLTIEKGEKILLYGKSGSGKSTLARILAMKIVPERNQLYFDQYDALDLDSETLKQEISYISQEEYLFTESIYQNILAFREIPYDEFLEISKLCLVEEIALKNILAYDTLLEEDGFNISGGERQRIVLARGLLKKSKIYILDETFSQMDIERERKILVHLFQKFHDQTIIVISHRFYNQDLFDRKIRMEKGKCYEKEFDSFGL